VVQEFGGAFANMAVPFAASVVKIGRYDLIPALSTFLFFDCSESMYTSVSIDLKKLA
jgi:hypothetical protein